MIDFRRNKYNNALFLSQIKKYIESNIDDCNFYFDKIDRDTTNINNGAILYNILYKNEYEKNLRLNINLYSDCGNNIIIIENLADEIESLFNKAFIGLDNFSVRIEDLQRGNISIKQEEEDTRRIDFIIYGVINY